MEWDSFLSFVTKNWEDLLNCSFFNKSFYFFSSRNIITGLSPISFATQILFPQQMYQNIPAVLIKTSRLFHPLSTRRNEISYGQIDNSRISCVGGQHEGFQEIWSVRKSRERVEKTDRKQMPKVSNSIFFILFHPDWDAMKSVFIANLSTPQKRMRLQDDDTEAHGSSVINHPIAPIQFKSENNTQQVRDGERGVSNWGFLLRFEYQNYDTFLWLRIAESSE